jgi:hypothetical protein
MASAATPTHVPPEQTGVGAAHGPVGADHVPPSAQIATPFSTHFVAPGTHTPQ